MAEQTLAPGPLTAGPGPEPRAGRWRGAVFLLVVIACLAVITVLVILIAPSAGAAGGCGGG
jgi:hypothetical protein